MSKNLSPKKLQKQQEWFDRHRKAKKAASAADLDLLGPRLAEAVAAHWREHDAGPLWREALQTPDLVRWWTEQTGLAFIGKPWSATFMRHAQRAGWVAFNSRERSLCPGRRFHAHGAEVSQAGPNEVGYRAASFVGAFRDAYGHSPDWVQMSAAFDENGAPLFTDPDDAAAQFRWLDTSGWLFQQEDGSLRRGKRAKIEARRRADALGTPATAG